MRTRKLLNGLWVPRWISPIVLAAVVATPYMATAQQGSWGNTFVHNSGNATLFGAHTFVAGGAGTQPGIIKTARTTPIGIVSFGPAATHSGANDAGHIDGYVGKYGTTAFTFPIGNGTKMRPVSISAPTSGDFKAAYWLENPNAATLPAGAPFPVANLGTGVTAVSNVEYWDIDGPSAVDLTLTWDAASNVNTLAGGNLSNLAIVGYNATTSKWESLGGTATGTLTGTGSVVATGVTPDNYVAFTFGSVTAEPTTPDLRPYLVLLNVDFTLPTTARSFTVRVRNMRVGTIATNPVIVRIYKPSPTSTIALTGAALTNWTVANTPTYYTLTSNLDVPEGTTGITITGNITLPASVPSGTHPLRVLIPDLSGGELATDNGNNEIIGKLTRN
ncbi:hypothetical protein DSL64_13755 [Dyadobacter luteus]|uniref:Uncharacterized protein n=1 Tax=Dyadobacter luteus TaxID=2259619 RepID=A0A3D8YB14_9BACT|nr:hypothetical protein [Dyadobacter luteus]REA60955.1 hypothetical protein DSL64_13755 [Dyadobacter luteus]